MNTRLNLIFLKGEEKTAQIERCLYNSRTQRYDVTFTNGKSYPYAHASIQWLKNPTILDPSMYQIAAKGTAYGNIQAISVFSGQEEWWHLVFEGGQERTYRKQELTIRKSCLCDTMVQRTLGYLQKVAGLNELKTDDGEVLLYNKFSRLTFLSEASALATYLNPQTYPVYPFPSGLLIFPFGGNSSQFQAVQNALSQKISVIQGPPGTGKTQTILNIIANLLIRGKTIQVVSNNNSATQNVLDKLSSPKYDLGFLVAALGKSENRKAFIQHQTGNYPNMDSWQATPGELLSMKSSVAQLSSDVSSYFAKQSRLATAKQELDALKVEAHYFDQYCSDTQLVLPQKAPKKNLRSTTILRVLQDCEAHCEQNNRLSLWAKLKTTFIYGLFEWDYHKTDLVNIITYLHKLFYITREYELMQEIAILESDLRSVNAQAKMAQLTDLSLRILKAVIYNRYSCSAKRPVFSEDAFWKKPQDILQEYPIILSTTFSSHSCLKDVTYDYIIMDEASQVDLVTGALAFASANCAVVVGDLKQLPNVIPDTLREQNNLIFRSYHLPDGYDYADNSFLKSICSVIPKVPQTLLREHYRCHPKIIGFCNQKFYQNQLIIMTEDHGEPNPLCVFRTTTGQHHRGHVNQRQIDVITQEVLPKLNTISPDNVGIIAPYRAQVQALASAIQDFCLEVDTVHKFQGREKDTIILTTVDDEVTDFSDDPYLLNVAISRAKKQLILVISGNDQPTDSNLSDLVTYIEYHNFSIFESELYSVFDLLYQQYSQQRMEYLQKHRTISQYDSENIMFATLEDLLLEMPELPFSLICHQKVMLLIRNYDKLTEDERRYATHPNTHVDFLIFNRITKTPVLAIEVDGFTFHHEGTRQADRDRMKDAIFSKYGIPLLRLPTNGSGEIQKIKEALRRLSGQ